MPASALLAFLAHLVESRLYSKKRFITTYFNCPLPSFFHILSLFYVYLRLSKSRTIFVLDLLFAFIPLVSPFPHIKYFLLLPKPFSNPPHPHFRPPSSSTYSILLIVIFVFSFFWLLISFHPSTFIPYFFDLFTNSLYQFFFLNYQPPKMLLTQITV